MILLKLRLRVDKTDFVYFIIISIVLYLISLLVAANLISFGANETFVGIHIFRNFTFATFGLSLLIFIISLVVIFMNVSSTIFTFEKGPLGLIFGEKDEKGYNRFLKDSEMKKAWQIKKVNIKEEKSDAGGIVMINDGKNMWVDNGEYHTLIIGQSGSGKTSALVDPQVRSLIKHDESMVISDLKGEIYRDHGQELRERGYNIVIINLREPSTGNSWNPLTIPYRMYKKGKKDKAKELLEDISKNIIVTQGTNQDPFWESSGSDYFCALALSLFKNAPENEVNISSISNMATDGEEKLRLKTYAQEFFNLQGENSDIYQYAKATVSAAAETKQSILSVFLSKIRQFTTREELSEMLSVTDFNMEDIGKEKTAVFLIVHDEKTTYHPLATIFLKQLYEVLIDVAHRNPDGRLKYRTNFILDEFANLPELKDVDSMVTAARSRSIRFTFIIQNFAQLDDVYGDKKAETIRSNCGNMIYLLTSELHALEEISKLCGEVKSKDDEKTVSTPLVTVTDLQKMKLNEIIVIRMRQKPYRTVLKAGYEIDWGKKYDKVFPEEREPIPVKTFDIKAFVDKEKRKNIADGVSLPNAGGGMVNSNPMHSNTNFDSMFSPVGNNPKPTTPSTPFNPGASLYNDNNHSGAGLNPAPSAQPSNDIDIDALIKDIDAQIAALEKEEAENKAKIEKEKNKEHKEIKQEVREEPKKQEPQVISRTVVEEPKKEVPKPVDNTKEKVNVDTSSVVVGNDIVTDDQYFDDFFGDDE